MDNIRGLVKEVSQILGNPEENIPTLVPLPPSFLCSYCGALFSTQAELDAHIASVHQTLPAKIASEFKNYLP